MSEWIWNLILSKISIQFQSEFICHMCHKNVEILEAVVYDFSGYDVILKLFETCHLVHPAKEPIMHMNDMFSTGYVFILLPFSFLLHSTSQVYSSDWPMPTRSARKLLPKQMACSTHPPIKWFEKYHIRLSATVPPSLTPFPIIVISPFASTAQIKISYRKHYRPLWTCRWLNGLVVG